MAAPQPWIQTHLKFYYQVQATVGEQITRVLDALAASKSFENTIVVFSSDHGDMQGAHGGMHEKWHVAYEEALHVPFIVSSPLSARRRARARDPDQPRRPDPDPARPNRNRSGRSALAKLQEDHTDARSLAGRDLSEAVRSAEPVATPEPVLFTTDDEISEGSASGASPVAGVAKKLRVYSVVPQPNHIETVVAEVEVDGEQHRVKFSRYHDNMQFWTVPGERDERLAGRKTLNVTEPEPDEFELYDLTLDPYEERNLAHPDYADDASRTLQDTMLTLLVGQLSKKRLTPTGGAVPGYRPPLPA